VVILNGSASDQRFHLIMVEGVLLACLVGCPHVMSPLCCACVRPGPFLSASAWASICCDEANVADSDLSTSESGGNARE